MKYDYFAISTQGQSWIDDLQRHATEAGFPDLDPSDMTASDRDLLVQYLRTDDGSLSESDQAFSESVADEIAALELSDSE